MGNQALSPAPCFDDQVYTTLSWADEKSTCRTLFQDCNIKKHDNPAEESDMRQDSSVQYSEKSGSIAASVSASSSRRENLPALTDNLSSSEPSSADEDDPVRFQQQGQDFHLQAEPSDQVVDVIAIHQFEPSITLSRSAEYYLGMAASSNDYTQGTSGSLERDARVDLVTSRGSSGGREDFDDDYRNDNSGTFGREG